MRASHDDTTETEGEPRFRAYSSPMRTLAAFLVASLLAAPALAKVTRRH